MKRAIGLVAAVGVVAGSAIGAAVATADGGPGGCPPPGQFISEVAQNVGPPGQVFKDFLGAAPGQVIAAECAPGHQ